MKYKITTQPHNIIMKNNYKQLTTNIKTCMNVCMQHNAM